MTNKLPTQKDVINYMDTLTNWGRWGKEDQLGTLNLITSTTRLNAIKLIEDGISISCSRPLIPEIAPDIRFQFSRFAIDTGEHREDTTSNAENNRRGASEFIGMVFHGMNVTHIDSLSHMFWNGKMYNGFSSNEVTSGQGTQKNAVDVAINGILSKCVLLDIPLLKNKKWLSSDEYVLPEDIENAEKYFNVNVEPGDILLIRTGNYKRRLEEGPSNPTVSGVTSCHVACAPYFKKKDISLLGSDSPNDINPSPYPNLRFPLHTVCLIGMGLWFLDNANLEQLASECIKRNRWSFTLSINPLDLKNCTGSPVNPVAIF